MCSSDLASSPKSRSGEIFNTAASFEKIPLSITGSIDRLHMDDRTTTTREELKRAMQEVLDESRSIEADKHRDHHIWITAKLESEKQSRERWDRIRGSVIGWLIIGVLGGIGMAVWHWIGSLLGRGQVAP